MQGNDLLRPIQGQQPVPHHGRRFEIHLRVSEQAIVKHILDILNDTVKMPASVGLPPPVFLHDGFFDPFRIVFKIIVKIEQPDVRADRQLPAQRLIVLVFIMVVPPNDLQRIAVIQGRIFPDQPLQAVFAVSARGQGLQQLLLERRELQIGSGADIFPHMVLLSFRVQLCRDPVSAPCAQKDADGFCSRVFQQELKIAPKARIGLPIGIHQQLCSQDLGRPPDIVKGNFAGDARAIVGQHQDALCPQQLLQHPQHINAVLAAAYIDADPFSGLQSKVLQQSFLPFGGSPHEAAAIFAFSVLVYRGKWIGCREPACCAAGTALRLQIPFFRHIFRSPLGYGVKAAAAAAGSGFRKASR